ncbi:MAG: hypothetical protein NZM38_08900 [Cytophagales bacterium]|nr:hypothetical protein [Cytophagales bacterium]MDW8384877.1 hypothetical protein [Flammeovirgaceae bacterium]
MANKKWQYSLNSYKKREAFAKMHILDEVIRDKGIICYSDNPRYTPFFLSNEEIVRIWSAEMFLQTELPMSDKAEEQFWEQSPKLKKKILNDT